MRTQYPQLGQMLSQNRSWEHFYSLRFLQRLGFYEEYLKFLAPLNIKSNMSAARHFYYTKQIQRLTEQNIGADPLDIIEVGAGAGNLACFLYLSGLVRSYCIVDLPEMLLLSAYQVSKYVPDAEIIFAEPGTDYHPAPGQFLFVQTQDVDKIPDNSMDMAINMMSFMEMDEAARDGYISHFYRVGKSNSLLFNVNRRQNNLPQRDGSTFDNHPLRYHYDPKDKVLFWEECPYHEFAREVYRVRMSLCIMRAALINVSEQ